MTEFYLLFLPILLWGVFSTVDFSMQLDADCLEYWPGYFLNLITWYLQEYCYYFVLLYWTSLDFFYALLINSNFDKKVAEVERLAGSESTSSSFMEGKDEEQNPGKGKIYTFTMLLFLSGALATNIILSNKNHTF